MYNLILYLPVSAQVKEEDILVLPLDIKKFESHKDAMKKVLDKFSKVDILPLY